MRKLQLMIFTLLFTFGFMADAKIFYEAVQSTVSLTAPLLDIDNLRCDGNTISSTNSNGDINLNPNGSGKVKFPDLTPSRACYIDADGGIAASAVSDTELGYLDGVTSSIQTQIDSKQATGNYITALTSDVTASGPGSAAATIANDAVTNAKAANMAESTIKGRAVGAGTGDPTDLTATQATAILNNFVGDSGSGGTKGLVPAPSSGDAAAEKFLKADGTWTATPASAGAPSGMIIAFAGNACPTGYLAADGSAVDRTTYAALFTVIGEFWGEGDNSTTFNLPDLRWTFLRGYGPDTTATGSGSAASNNATFTAHGFTRTGQKVRMTSGTLSGITTSTDYWVIVVDANTLAFATSYANALAGTKIVLSGANSAVIVQFSDTAASSRVAQGAGANTGANVGSRQTDSFQGHHHSMSNPHDGASGSARDTTDGTGSTTNGNVTAPSNMPAMGDVRYDEETRPQNVYVLYCIKT